MSSRRSVRAKKMASVFGAKKEKLVLLRGGRVTATQSSKNADIFELVDVTGSQELITDFTGATYILPYKFIV